ncbi:glycoside hydrolase N-terminal domain-containing protein [Pontibacter korlensis]|uniref:Alpha-L-fucosidase n=1 Tax=Pontibacter korlensis TaxID=400092 RepID=A0A0E3UV03_9BACT|nr:glycoside hydrolase N-terminal domain-containing protein [Pontibacter korlensis]AKD02092.1 alpha-L-fucosidase [Pontibacter korlensis]
MTRFQKYFSAFLILCSMAHQAVWAQTDPFQQPERGFSSWLPAPNWEHALLSGNGTMGAMVMGHPHDETVILNHALLYLPATEPKFPIDQASRLPEIRQLIMEGKYEEAAKIPVEQSLKEGYGGHLWSDPYVPAFDVNLQMAASNVEKYKRMVDFETGEAKVAWTDGQGTYVRKVFVSRPDSVVVISIKGTGKINGSLSFARRPVEWSQWEHINNNIASAQAAAKDNWLTYRSEYKKRWKGSLQGYEGVGRVITKGGSAKAVGSQVQVQDADQVLLLIKISPNYNYANSQVEALQQYLESMPQNYETLLSKHSKVHGDLFRSVRLDLGGSTGSGLYSETINLRTAQANASAATIEKQFDAARYNIISATGTNPPNLQGIWGGSWTPPWSSDFTHDGNVEVAISSLLTSNTPELLLAYFDYHDKRLHYYRDNAKRMFGTRGIHVPSHTSTHGWDNHFDPIWCLSLWTGGAGWTASYYYDYWLHTGDRKFLKERAYPFMKEAALFYEDFVTIGQDGKYVFNPSYSPENTPSNSSSQASLNATMDVMIAKQLLRNCIAAAQELKIDKEQVKVWKTMLTKMPDYQVAEDGALKEWLTPVLKDNHQHRHISHLYALYDIVDPDFKQNPELMKAAAMVVEEHMKFRREENGGEMVFGLAQMAFVTANLEDAATTAELINWLARYYWTSGMATYHNPGSLFNMDLSGGYPSAIMRALAYAEPGLIKLLPALPPDWKKGKIEGLLLRGQVELKSLAWDGNQVNVTLQSGKKQQVEMMLPKEIASVKTVAGNAGKVGTKGRSATLMLPANREVQLSISMK